MATTERHERRILSHINFPGRLQRQENAALATTGATILDGIYRHNDQVNGWATQHGGELAHIAAQSADSKTAVATIAATVALPLINGIQIEYQGRRYLRRREHQESTLPILLGPAQESIGSRIEKGVFNLAVTAGVAYAANRLSGHFSEEADAYASFGALIGTMAYLRTAKEHVRNRMSRLAGTKK
jgi:hypothetical protein